jgi:hypothetical protein
MATTTRNRVSQHTAGDVNRRIQQDIESNVRYYQRHKSQIPRRLQELDEEWDIERAIQANAAAVVFIGLVMGTLGRSRWLLVPAAVSGFLFQHAVQGWCPPIPLFRRLGFRTAFEIEHERQALKLLRGDYKKVSEADADVEDVLEAVQS